MKLVAYFRITLIWLMLWLLVMSSYGQYVFHDNAPYSDEKSVTQLYRLVDSINAGLNEKGWFITRWDLFEQDSNIYILADGRSDLFVFTGDSLTNLYTGVHHGFNYRSLKFIWKGDIYSYGGYGFWRKNGWIIKFLPHRGEWEQLAYTSMLEDGMAWLSGDSLFILKTEESVIINLENQSVRHQSFQNELNSHFDHLAFEGVNPITFSKYVYNPSEPGILINKETNEISLARISTFENIRYAISHIEFIHIKGNTADVYDKNGFKASESVDTELEFYTRFDPNPDTAATSNTNLIILLILVSIGLIGLYYWLRSRHHRTRERKSNLEFEHSMIDRFRTIGGRTISSDELDSILGIDHIRQPETLRNKRAQLFKEINAEFRAKTESNLIIRKKDPEDGRKYVYLISGMS